MFGSRTEFGLEFHVERDPGLLCVDVFVGGLHVNGWDNAFYPPLLVKKLKDELGRFRVPAAPPVGFVSPVEAFRLAEEWTSDDTGPGAEFGRCEFLEWGECTDDVLAFAFPDGDRVHLACRTRGVGGPPASAVVSMSRLSLVETLEQGLAVAEREWAARLAALKGPPP
ncbi:hypothetical protein BBK82_23590 [Lentzea guizhouensis]|uniref:Uncharacterized protein n=1 Tax=Lentzea guizhouensis TaxID=1586287 RepID=A0A1B2HLJ7_9PSEU|nr:hypothetical protein [Lentzea guizhouensis]ANZ38598.1 hypothetical protein BBK82_23590 [Lentzea guizhouensis]